MAAALACGVCTRLQSNSLRDAGVAFHAWVPAVRIAVRACCADLRGHRADVFLDVRTLPELHIAKLDKCSETPGLVLMTVRHVCVTLCPQEMLDCMQVFMML